MKAGSLGEISVQKELLKLGYEVYSPVSDNTKYDLIAVKGTEVFRVEVKTTSRQVAGNYKVQIKKVRSNKSENKITPFDNSEVDILAVYIEPEDIVVLYEAKSLTVKTELTVILDGDLQRSVTRS